MAVKTNLAEAVGAPGRKAGSSRLSEAVGRVDACTAACSDLIKDEFDRMGWDDINPVQALLMFNIGDAEMTAGELLARLLSGLERLVQPQEAGRDRLHLPGALRADRRSVRIRLDAQGGGSRRGDRRALRPAPQV